MSGSESRRMKDQILIRIHSDMRAAIRSRADAAGLSIADFARSILLSADPLRPAGTHRAPTLAETQISAFARDLLSLKAEFGKIGSNINQLAHQANAGAAIPRPELARCSRELAAAQAELAALSVAVSAALVGGK